MEATYAAHITGDMMAEAMKNKVKVILDFHTWLKNPKLYRSHPTAIH